jgi:hypothetical protein
MSTPVTANRCGSSTAIMGDLLRDLVEECRICGSVVACCSNVSKVVSSIGPVLRCSVR